MTQRIKIRRAEEVKTGDTVIYVGGSNRYHTKGRRYAILLATKEYAEITIDEDDEKIYADDNPPANVSVRYYELSDFELLVKEALNLW